MMISTLLKANGEIRHYAPAGKKFTLDELQKAVGGLIEFVQTPKGNILVVNEEGKINDLPLNVAATLIIQKGGIPDVIVGDALYIDPKLIQ